MPRNLPPEDADPKTDFEDVLDLIGGWGRYQKVLLLFLLVSALAEAYSFYIPVFYIFVPDHWCSLDHLGNVTGLTDLELLEHVIPKDENGERSKCLMYDVDPDKGSFK